MADLTAYLNQIRTAKRGETVRDAITSSLKAMNSDGINAQTLSGRPPSYFATAKDVNDAFLTGKFNNKEVFETSVVKGSTKAVQSGALYDLFDSISGQLSELLKD